jgi:hypothetical protein
MDMVPLLKACVSVCGYEQPSDFPDNDISSTVVMGGKEECACLCKRKVSDCVFSIDQYQRLRRDLGKKGNMLPPKVGTKNPVMRRVC